MNYAAIMAFLKNVTDNSAPLFFILGPCAFETPDHAYMIASFLKNLSNSLNIAIIFKASFDKANRTSKAGYRSIGIEQGSILLDAIRRDFDLPVLTDIHESWQAEVIAPYVDIIQIPAFLCRQTDLLVAAAKTGKYINIKKGQFASPHVMEHAAEKVRTAGGNKVWLCERGTMFGYSDLIVDFRNFSLMKSYHYPVVFDVTHAVQKPSGLGNASGGERLFVADLARSAVAHGIAGIFMEIHEEPERALSDGPNSIRLAALEPLLRYLKELDEWTKNRTIPLSV